MTVPNSGGSPYPIQPALTAIAVQRRNPAWALIADQVMPRLPAVGTKRFRWLEYPPGQNITVPDTRVGRKGSPRRIELGAVERFDECPDYGLEDSIPLDDQTQAAASVQQGGVPIDPLARSVEAICDAITLDREQRVAQAVFNAANYAAANIVDLSAAGQHPFSDRANSDPITLMNDLFDQMLFHPTTLVFGRRAWTVFRRHPVVVKAVLGTAGDEGIVSREDVAELFEVKTILIGEAWLNSARPGQAVARERVWGNHIACHFTDPGVTSAEGGVTWGVTQQYAAGGVVKYASTRFEPVGLRGATVVRVGETIKELVLAPDAGALILNTVAS